MKKVVPALKLIGFTSRAGTISNLEDCPEGYEDLNHRGGEEEEN